MTNKARRAVQKSVKYSELSWWKTEPKYLIKVCCMWCDVWGGHCMQKWFLPQLAELIKSAGHMLPVCVWVCLSGC